MAGLLLLLLRKPSSFGVAVHQCDLLLMVLSPLAVRRINPGRTLIAKRLIVWYGLVSISI